MFGIGAQELILILVVALLVFGPKRLPELARTMGKGLAEFRRASTDLRHSLQSEIEYDPAKKGAAEGDIRPPEAPRQAAAAEAPAQAVGAPEPAGDETAPTQTAAASASDSAKTAPAEKA